MDHHEDEYRVAGEQLDKQSDEEAAARFEETKKSIEAKMTLHQSNLNSERCCLCDVLRQLCKLPWSDCELYLLKCFYKVHKGKYGQIHLIASLMAGLSCYHDEFTVAVVDEVLEEIRLGLESNDYGMQQRRIAHMRYLGELYNHEHVDSSVVFDTLYI